MRKSATAGNAAGGGRLDLIGVSFDGMGRAPGQAGAPQVLRAAGLSAVLGPSVGRAIDNRGGRGVLALSNLVLATGLVGRVAFAKGPKPAQEAALYCEGDPNTPSASAKDVIDCASATIHIWPNGTIHYARQPAEQGVSQSVCLENYAGTPKGESSWGSSTP